MSHIDPYKYIIEKEIKNYRKIILNDAIIIWMTTA